MQVFSGGDEVETQLIQKMSEIIDEEIVYRQVYTTFSNQFQNLQFKKNQEV